MAKNVPNERAALRYAGKLLEADLSEHYQVEGDTPRQGYQYAIEVLGYLAEDKGRRAEDEKTAGIAE